VISFDGSEININAQTICIHSDTLNTLDIAKNVYNKLHKE
jgi:lactam utilization protein B